MLRGFVGTVTREVSRVVLQRFGTLTKGLPDEWTVGWSVAVLDPTPHADTDNEILAHIPKGEPGEGIYAWHCCGETGKLTGPLHINAVAPNPAFITKHPSSDTLYVSTECIHHEGCGEVISMSVDEQGKLTELARESAGGRSTCYLTVVGELLAAVNYW